jgi:hypothetical protein
MGALGQPRPRHAADIIAIRARVASQMTASRQGSSDIMFSRKVSIYTGHVRLLICIVLVKSIILPLYLLSYTKPILIAFSVQRATEAPKLFRTGIPFFNGTNRISVEYRASVVSKFLANVA